MMVDKVPGDEYSYKSAKKKSKVEKVTRKFASDVSIPPSKKLVPESAFGANLRVLAENYVRGRVSRYNLTEKQLELLDEYWGLEKLEQAREAESVLSGGKKASIELTAAGTKIKEIPEKKVKGEEIGEIVLSIPEPEQQPSSSEEKPKGKVLGELVINVDEDSKAEEARESFKAASKYLAGGILDENEARILSKFYGDDFKLLRIKRLKTMREMQWGPTRDEAEIEKRVAALEERGFTTPLGKKPPRQGLRRKRKPRVPSFDVPMKEQGGEIVFEIEEKPLQKEMKQVSVPVSNLVPSAPSKKDASSKKPKPPEEKVLEKLVPVFSESFKKMFDTKIDELIQSEVKKSVESKAGLIDKSIASVSSQDVYFKGAEDERIRLLKAGLLPKKYATLEEKRKAGLIDEERERQLKLYASEGGKKAQMAKKEKREIAKEKQVKSPLEALPSDVGKTFQATVAEPAKIQISQDSVKQETTILEFPKEREPEEKRVADLSAIKAEKERLAPVQLAPFRIYTERGAVPYGPKSREILAKISGTAKSASIVFLEKGEPAKEYKASRDWLLRYAEVGMDEQRSMLKAAEEKSKPVKPLKTAAVKAKEFAVEAVRVPITAVKVASVKEQEKKEDALRELEGSLERTGKAGGEALKYSAYAVHETMKKAAKSTVSFLSKPKVRKWMKSPVGHVLPVRRQTDLRKVEMKRLRLYAER